MTTPKRITRFRVETERTFVFRCHDGSRAGWCEGCGAEVEAATVAGAAASAGLGEMEVYRMVEWAPSTSRRTSRGACSSASTLY